MIDKAGDEMLYAFASLPDKTELSYSEVFKDENQQDTVRILAEKWDASISDFDTIELYLPSRRILKSSGFSPAEADELLAHIYNLQDIILECAREEVGE